VLEVRTQELDFRQKEEGASRTRIRELKWGEGSVCVPAYCAAGQGAALDSAIY
jgi:hypothetical protein